MRLLYTTGISLYAAIIALVSIWNPKARMWINGRKIAAQPLSERPVWMHCASLGEFEQGRPVIEMLKKQHPEIKILLTFFSPSGYEVRKNYSGADLVAYLPVDTPVKVNNFIATHRPVIAIFVKYEIWHNLLDALYKKEIPTYLIAARFRKEQVYFRWWGTWFAESLKKFTHIFVQDLNSESLLNSLNVNSQITGDTRFDRVIEVAQGWQAIKKVEDFAKNGRIIVAGSTWPDDEKMLSTYLERNGTKYNLKIILAPHEISADKINAVKSKFKNAALYSEGNGINANTDVLIIDTIGILNKLYKYGEICYVGGGFGAGIHNTLEAAVYGKALIFGPKYSKFQEALDLVECQAAISYSTYGELELALNNLFDDQSALVNAGDESKKLVLANRGAADIIVKAIGKKL
jgi:3-deoxy-D-manno-octulosonic-acid transferase